MDVGLYLLKYPFRRLIGFLLPLYRNVEPNRISLNLIPVGIVMAWVYHQALTTGPAWLFWIGILLGFVRMIVATLDGLVAVHYHKSSLRGDVLNRLTPELCDMILLTTLVVTKGLYPLGAFVLLFAWATPFFGLLGAPSGLAVQSVGPVGQTDRLAALMVFSCLQFLSLRLGWGLDFIQYFFVWIILGGVLTLGLRFYRVFREAKVKDQAKQQVTHGH